MPEIHLKPKITLKKKQTCAFTYSGILKTILYWETDTDLDLCLFFKKKDGNVGGIFSNEYRNNKSDLGTLEHFPFMQHLGDVKEPGENEKESKEQINIAQLNEIDTAYLCVVNYGAATEGRDVNFATEGGRLEIKSDSGDHLEVDADSSDPGHVYLVATIKNENGTNSLTNESKVMDLGTAFEQIPGFSLICNS